MTRLPSSATNLSDYIRETFLSDKARVAKGCKFCMGDEAGYRNSEMCRACYKDHFSEEPLEREGGSDD